MRRIKELEQELKAIEHFVGQLSNRLGFYRAKSRFELRKAYRDSKDGLGRALDDLIMVEHKIVALHDMRRRVITELDYERKKERDRGRK